MVDLRRPRLNMRDKKSPKLPLDLTVSVTIKIIIIINSLIVNSLIRVGG